MSALEDRLEFGLTNDPVWMARAAAWRDDAIADGWEAKAQYGPNEGIDRACRLTKENFVAHVLTRDNEKDHRKYRYQASVNVWGPDGLAIEPPNAYSWAALQEGLRTCGHCRSKNVDTERVGFAGRCCAKCLPAMRKKHEYPGWTN